MVLPYQDLLVNNSTKFLILLGETPTDVTVWHFVLYVAPPFS